MNGLEIADPAGQELAGFDPYLDFTEKWLANRRFSEHTRDAYRRDLGQFLQWCARHQLDPLQARFTDVNAWGRSLEEPDEEAGRAKPLAPTSVARKMSAVSSWYNFLVKLGALAANPAAAADRPMVDRDFSSTVAFTQGEATRMLMTAAAGDPWMGRIAPLLATWLVELGTRATETSQVQIEDLGHDRGHRIVQMKLKGGKRRTRTIPPHLATMLDDYLAWQAGELGVPMETLSGPLFLNAEGQPVNRLSLYRFVRRLAKAAGLPNADRTSPHSFRHAWNTMARRRGADLERRQYAMGHSDPRTTRRYDRSDGSLEDDPSLLVAAAVAPSLIDEEDL